MTPSLLNNRSSCLPSTSQESLLPVDAPHARPGRFVQQRRKQRRRIRVQAFPPETPIDRLNSAADALQNQPPHFGSRAAQQALQTAVQQLQQLSPWELPGAIPESYTRSLIQLQQTASSTVQQPVSAVQRVVDSFQGSLAEASGGASRQVMDLTGSSSPVAPVLEPHWGTTAALSVLSNLLQRVGALLDGIVGGDSEVGRSLNSAVQTLKQASQATSNVQLPRAVTGVFESLNTWLSQLVEALSPGSGVEIPNFDTSVSTILAALQQVQEQGIGGYSLATLALVSAAVLTAMAASVPPENFDPMLSVIPADKLPTRYSAEGVGGYWSRRPVRVAERSAVVAAEAAKFGMALLTDIWTGSVQANAGVRARQLRESIEKLGPAYVKVAQALSTRVDLLDMNYLLEIERLQDRVPPFPTEAALLKMSEAFNAPVQTVFSSISPRPVAAASLGQVYRATLSAEYGSTDVAVKVRRPDVLESVALDLYLMRSLALYLQTFPEVTTDWASLIDEWAVRFFNEMDYVMEAQNAVTFKEQVTPLCEGIVVPDVFPSLSNDCVLTTQWMEGEKLSESNADDVRQLCNTLLNCYLIQLLDTGFLHADPHPGNLIRTPEGKICILDYGLMTDVTPNQSIALVEYIAHLSVEDWEGVADDLVNLGFMPPGTDPRAARIVDPLGNILEQLVKGGGARGFNIDKVTAELEALSRSYPFSIPPYFALILRAFSVIEGIALRVDPSYAIVKECFPYLSRRLLTDESPRSKQALRDLLYGNRRHLDVSRLSRIVSGFNSFTVQGLTSREDKAMMDRTTKEALGVVFSTRGTYVQELLVEELAAAVDALSREALSELLQRVLGSVPAVAALRGVEVLGPLRPLLLPLPTPLEIMTRMAPVVAPTEEDEEALSTIRGVMELISSMQAAGDTTNGTGSNAPLNPREIVASLQGVAPLLPDLLPGIAYTGQLFVRTLMRRVFQRIANDLGGPLRGEMISALDFMASAPFPPPPGLFPFPGRSTTHVGLPQTGSSSYHTRRTAANWQQRPRP